ncbi:cold-shock protein [Nocardia speluncae]|nr:cold shock domain-containing protein [Nocardia speluncae]
MPRAPFVTSTGTERTFDGVDQDITSGEDLVMTPSESAAPGIDRSDWRRGRVFWFDSEKGFGYIKPDDGTEQVFVEYRCIETDGYRTLHAGQPVTFVSMARPRGHEAVTVRPAAGQPEPGVGAEPA